MSDWNLYYTGVATSQFNILQALHLEGCGIQLSHLQSLDAGICRFDCQQLQIQLPTFSLKNNAGIGSEKGGVEIACKIVRECKVRDFNIGACKLDKDGMSEMLEGLRQSAVAVLGLELNKIGKKGMEIAGTLVKECSSIEDINLSECAEKFEDAEIFGTTAKGSKIQRLTVEHRKEGIVGGYGSAVRECNVLTLVILMSTLAPRDAILISETSSQGKISRLEFSALIKRSPPQFTHLAPAFEKDCESIRCLLPIVKNEISVPVAMEGNLVNILQSSLDDLQGEGPVITLPAANKTIRLTSKNGLSQTDIGSDLCDQESNSAEEIDKQPENAFENEEEIMMEMETEYMDISNGADTMTWLKKYKHYRDLVADILTTYGLSIHRYEMKDDDRQLVVEILSHCSKLKKFSLTHVTDLKPLLKTLMEISKGARQSLPKVTNVCFAGHPAIDKELSYQFVKYVELFKAERLTLRYVNASHEGLQCLRDDLKGVKQGKYFKRLEIFHNPNIGDKGWECLAGIAKDFADDDAPLQLSACYCNVEDEQLETFKNAVGSTKVGRIDVSGNQKLTKKGFQTLGEIVKGSKVTSVALQDCNLDMEKIQSFNTGCGIESPMQCIAYLNVANNPKLSQDGVEEIKKTVHGLGVRNLNIASCMLGNITFEHEFESLDISGNPKCESILELAKTVKERFYMSDCMLRTSELRNLALEMKKQQRKKLEEIDVSDASRQIDSDFIDSLVEMLKDVTEYLTVADGITIPTSGEC